jgi:hypothetical protein
MGKHTPSDAASESTIPLYSPKQQRNPSLQLTKRAGGLTRSLPASATTTRINIASDGSTSGPAEEQPDPTSSGKTADTDDKEISKDTSAIKAANSEDHQSDPTGEPAVSSNLDAAVTQPAGWLSWVYAPFVYNKTIRPRKQQRNKRQNLKSLQRTIRRIKTTSLRLQSQARNKTNLLKLQKSRQHRRNAPGFRCGTAHPRLKGRRHSRMKPLAMPRNNTLLPPLRHQGRTKTLKGRERRAAKPSAWSFFFRDSAQERTQEAQATETTIIQDPLAEQSTSVSDSKAGRKTEVINKGNVKVNAPLSGPPLPDNVVSKSAGAPEALVPAAPEASKQLQKIIPNQVLPKFRDTFALQDRPTLLQSLGRFLHYSKEPSNKHVYKLAYPQRIKKALAIGIHGYFPAPLIRSVLGQPTGTSVRFSTLAAEAIRKYTDDQGYTCEIQKIALEGEGRIAERVDLLWKLLLNWMEEIRSADFILVACHSQGVPVGIMLVAKLILFGCINANRVGVCAMAGVNLGPFADYKSRWISGSAGELFEFALPYSKVSKDYESALRTCIDFGVRISYIGSIDDQLVSLEVKVLNAFQESKN